MNGKQLKNSILQLAIQGKLVPQDPNDEPASVLLQRIRAEKAKLLKEGKLKKKDLIETPITEDEIPFEIPDSWELVRLGEISTYANKKKKINATKADPNIWGLDLEDIEKGGRLLYLKTAGERKAIGEKTIFSEGDILYSKLRPYLLKILIAPKNGICTPEIIPFTCYGDICKSYIVNLLKSSYINDYINSVTFGVKMPRVGTETMTSLVLPLPPLAEQKRIVEKIEELMPIVEKYGKAQVALDKLSAELPETLKKSILQEAIQGKLVPQDPNDEPASVLLERIRKEKQRLVKEGKLKKKDLIETPITEDEIPFDIPDSWQWVNFFYCVDILYGYPFDSTRFNECEEGFPIIRIRDILPSKTKTYTTENVDDRYVIKKGDMLVGMDGNFNVRFWQSNDAYLNQRVCRIKAKESILNQKYLYYYLPYALDDIFETVSFVTVKHLSDKHFRAMRIPLPPLAEQKRIVAKIEELMGKIDNLKK